MKPVDAYWHAFESGWSKALEDIVVKSGDAKLICLFAEDVEGANIKRLEDAIIKTGNVEWAYNFASNVYGANISNLIDYVLVKEPEMIRKLFSIEPSLKRKYELGEIRSIIRGTLK